MKDKEKYIKGTWYKDRDGDFIKFDGFDEGGDVKLTAAVLDGECEKYNDTWDSAVFPKCIPMTMEEMKEYLPEEEWWIEPSNELFPIY